MKRLDKKLSLWVVSFATIILVTSLGFMFGVSRKAIRQEAINRATDILENTTLRVSVRIPF